MFLQHVLQSKFGLWMKNKFHLLTGTVKLADQSKESLCSPVVTFPSFEFGSEGHGVQPHPAGGLRNFSHFSFFSHFSVGFH